MKHKYEIKFRRKNKNKICKKRLKVICFCHNFKLLKDKNEKINVIYVESNEKENIYEMKSVFDRKLFGYGNILKIKEV